MKEINTKKAQSRLPYEPVVMRIKAIIPGRVLCQSGGLTVQKFEQDTTTL